MTIKDRLSELKKELEGLQARIAAKVAEARSDERVPAEQRARLETLEAQTKAVKDKLPENGDTAWEAVKHEVERDFEALGKDFDHAIGYIDQHFRNQK